jgi:hydroxymethylbilane synthase
MTPGLSLAGYLPRADPRDVLVRRTGAAWPAVIATASPRRRLQLARLFPSARFVEIRGNVDTRLRKIAEGQAEATALAAAGLARLGIQEWPGLEFLPYDFSEVVPAVGQGAIAVQCRTADLPRFRGIFDAETAKGVGIERALQAALGGGCHTAFGAHATENRLYFFHEATGLRTAALAPGDFDNPGQTAARVLGQFGLIQK